MIFDPIRAILLTGLLFHKVFWEAMKRRGPAEPARVSTAPQPLPVRFVKLVKIAILLGIATQTVLPEILPISADPAGLKIGGLILFLAGLAIAVTGRWQLGDNWLDIEAAGVKKEQKTVAEGIYAYVRHPIYTGDLLLIAGLELALNSWLFLFVFPLAVVVTRQAIREEQKLLETLPGYDAYCRRTRRFIPFIA
jgi:protein-S-isoprenylcysteine O-methyltransferase Ste14